ncbi:MAG: 4'-phosphopantetheinyl transferase superfamily protein [Ruminococcaceae bacterium]|nr:4'-phosphopantetheinyl transferase superfamily protein [Oscillospiraceae bacterium]
MKRSDMSVILLAVDKVRPVAPAELQHRLKVCGQNAEYLVGVSAGLNSDARRSALLTLLELAEFAGLDTRALTLARTDKGKPYFVADGNGAVPEFSLSHADKFVAAAISPQGRVGVDIELGSGFDEDRLCKMAKRFFSDGELTDFESAADRRREFLKIWTRKEAVSKYFGTGEPYAYDTRNTTLNFISLEAGEGVLSLCFEGYRAVRIAEGSKKFVDLENPI